MTNLPTQRNLLILCLLIFSFFFLFRLTTYTIQTNVSPERTIYKDGSNIYIKLLRRDIEDFIALNKKNEISLKDFAKELYAKTHNEIQGNTYLLPDCSSLVLRYLNMNSLDLSDTIFKEADLSYTNLKGANLTRVDMRDANLINTNLESAILFDADLSTIKYDETTNFKGAAYNSGPIE